MRQQPTPDQEMLRELKSYLEDDLNKSIFQLYNRSHMLLGNDKLPKSLISLEMLESAFSFFEAGHGHAELTEAYPVEAWREDTVEVPRAWIRVLVEAWQKYKKNGFQTTLGEAFELEGGGQGKQPAKHWLEMMNRATRMSAAVIVEYLNERSSGKSASWERACEIVAQKEDVSLDTVKRATNSMKEDILRKLSEYHVLKEGKSS